MKTLVFFLEEPSARAMLEGVLPRILPNDWIPRYVVFEGKQDLEKQLFRKLKAWKIPNCFFVVMRDKDSGDCYQIKAHLSDICKQANKSDALIRIAIHELESWYLGDLPAVGKGLNIKHLSKKQRTRKFTNPDALANASQELKKLTKQKYQKLSGSRAIGPNLSMENNKSHSFNIFIKGIHTLIERNSKTLPSHG